MRLSVFIWLLLPLTLFAQIKGRIINSETGEGIPFATISLSATEGLYTDLEGDFSLESDYAGKSVYVSCVGFKTDTIQITSRDFLKIELAPHSIRLAPIVVSDGKIKSTRIGVPKKRKGHVTFWARPSSQWALFIPAEEAKSGSLITLIHYQIEQGHLSSSEVEGAHFRIHLYENNLGMPGSDLLGNLIVHPDRSSRWQSIDISKYHLLVPANGIFISMEWLPNVSTGTYTYYKMGSKEKFTGTQYGYKLNGHKPTNSMLRTFYYNPNEGHTTWYGGYKFPDGKNYIPCLALEVIEL